jgi:Asp-tRNA(Asn)/Glu-tRNA(Gln) amidotransferase A subunit family amidase
MLSAAMNGPVTGSILVNRFLRDGGIDKLRAMRLDEPPTLLPLGAEWDDVGQSKRGGRADIGMSQLTSPPDFAFSTVYDYASAYRKGSTTPTMVAEAIIAAIADSERGDRPLRVFVAASAEDILDQAAAAAARLQADKPLSVLDGVPVAIKDELDQIPYPTTAGTSFLGVSPAPEDSTVVARLRRAGALLIGKTNMNEIGIIPEGFNLHHGTVRNPYNLDHHSGGSSSGSAAAVAAGFCPVSIGADGGGSIRIPAAHCGLVGLKPSYGRVSMFGGAPLCWSVDHCGPLAASVADVALAYLLIAGPDTRDPSTMAQPAPELGDWRAGDLEGITLGVYRPWFEHATTPIVDAADAMLKKMVRAGAELVDVQIPELDEMRIAHVVTILSEMAASMENLKANWGEFAPPTRINLTLGRAFTAHDYIQSQRLRTRAMAIFQDVFSQVDAVVTPATGITAPEIPPGSLGTGWSHLGDVTEAMRYVFPANLTGLPAITFPVGYEESGLPIGMQVMGQRWQEKILLRIAHVAEQSFRRQLPATFYRMLP